MYTSFIKMVRIKDILVFKPINIQRGFVYLVVLINIIQLEEWKQKQNVQLLQKMKMTQMMMMDNPDLNGVDFPFAGGRSAVQRRARFRWTCGTTRWTLCKHSQCSTSTRAATPQQVATIMASVATR